MTDVQALVARLEDRAAEIEVGDLLPCKEFTPGVKKPNLPAHLDASQYCIRCGNRKEKHQATSTYRLLRDAAAALTQLQQERDRLHGALDQIVKLIRPNHNYQWELFSVWESAIRLRDELQQKSRQPPFTNPEQNPGI
jgi:hypothetical protein